ncbi:MarR family transcriptional regulator [Nonomuraea jiangxiensis]|uniref:DNA-binding transcriptional regulator, MarR family n=1 Tax=Nonomuraea jiangxiensis TaxID=633440 RepID=A0A1G9AW08_9ACTN|nr:MarR family transcriptional regulator [Nonomuraea jiangxiensis]SDK31569.1 DNA-binding transcriptional regulator, MarR family [Nonomuraea jiangxiensis]
MEPNTPHVDELELAAGLGRIKTMMRLLDTPRDLSMTSLSTLASLERLGPRRITELAVLEGVTQPAMTQLISRLEREELAERLPDPADRRVVVAAITEHGRAELARRRAAQAKRLAELLAELSEADRAAIAAALPALDRLTAHALGALPPSPPSPPTPPAPPAFPASL